MADSPNSQFGSGRSEATPGTGPPETLKSPVSDADLAQAFNSDPHGPRGKAAFERLWQRHHKVVWGRLRTLCGGNDADADDLVQQTWLQVLQDLPRTYKERMRFRGWVLRIARNRFIDYRRSQGKAGEVPWSEECLHVGGADPESEPRITDGIFRDLLRHLTDSEAFVMGQVAEGFSYEEIASERGWSHAYVRNLVCTARGKLRTQYERYLNG